MTQTVTASPTPSETPTPEVTHYRLMTVMAGHPDVTFVVATLTIERQIPGQNAWTTVYSREVDFKTTVRQARGTFTNEALGDNSASGGGSDTSSGGGYNPAGSDGSNSTTAGAANSTSGAANLTTTGLNTTGGANSTRPAQGPGNVTSVPGRGAAGNTSPITP